MRKISLLVLTAVMICAIGANPSYCNENNTMKRPPQHMEQARQQFEQRLKLTDKQKEKAKAIHQKGMEQMKPIMSQLQAKRKELHEIKSSNLEETAKNEKIAKIREEVKALDKKARDIRKQNSQEFENILTKKQKKELEKMKAEGRERFEKKHPPRPPFNMFGAPEFWQKRPLFENNNIE